MHCLTAVSAWCSEVLALSIARMAVIGAIVRCFAVVCSMILKMGGCGLSPHVMNVICWSWHIIIRALFINAHCSSQHLQDILRMYRQMMYTCTCSDNKIWHCIQLVACLSVSKGAEFPWFLESWIPWFLESWIPWFLGSLIPGVLDSLIPGVVYGHVMVNCPPSLWADNWNQPCQFQSNFSVQL